MAAPSAGPALAARPETLGTRPGGMNISQRPTFSATPGQCGGQLTVTQVSNRTITVTRPDGSTATIRTTTHTRYTEYGHTVSASAIRVGSTVYVVGACTGQGRSITATSIEITN